jgi:flagellar L-ring protein precursor FlgH
MKHNLMNLFGLVSTAKRFLPMGLALAGACLVSACATVPPTNVQQPMTARPVAVPAAPASNGAIYTTGPGSMMLFEDRHARNVGDILTIVINEKTNAAKQAETKADHKQSNDFSVTGLHGLPGKSLLGANLTAGADNKFDGSGSSNTNNTFTGIITVTVIEVLANGNLMVSGEKQLGINQGNEYIRFSGVVNPSTITGTNTVSSTQVADARIEYRGSGTVDQAQVMGWLAKFFMTFLPF